MFGKYVPNSLLAYLVSFAYGAYFTGVGLENSALRDAGWRLFVLFGLVYAPFLLLALVRNMQAIWRPSRY